MSVVPRLRTPVLNKSGWKHTYNFQLVFSACLMDMFSRSVHVGSDVWLFSIRFRGLIFLLGNSARAPTKSVRGKSWKLSVALYLVISKQALTIFFPLIWNNNSCAFQCVDVDTVIYSSSSLRCTCYCVCLFFTIVKRAAMTSLTDLSWFTCGGIFVR